MRPYIVQPSDTPASIAAVFAGCPKCARDLVFANTHKPSVVHPNGFLTFRELRAGETINLPDKWFSGELDARPDAYFKALPYADGTTGSSLGVGLAAAVLGDFSSLDAALAKIAELPQIANAEFPAAAAQVAASLSQAMQAVASSTNPATIGHVKDAQASIYSAGQSAMRMAAAHMAGDSAGVDAARAEAQRTLSAALDSARAALKSHYDAIPVAIPSLPPTQPSPTVPGPVTTIPAAIKALISFDPCAPSSAPAVCAAQVVLGQTPDGKYGDTTAAAIRSLVPSAPPACNPRPTWWAPTGQRNCTGVVSPQDQVTPPAQKKELGMAGITGLALAGAAAVGGAIYLSVNPGALKKLKSR